MSYCIYCKEDVGTKKGVTDRLWCKNCNSEIIENFLKDVPDFLKVKEIMNVYTIELDMDLDNMSDEEYDKKDEEIKELAKKYGAEFDMSGEYLSNESDGYSKEFLIELDKIVKIKSINIDIEMVRTDAYTL